MVATLILRRLALGLLTLWLVSLLVFGATLALPGDTATAILGRDATPARLTALRAQLDLDEPVVSRYVSWLKGMATGDLGESAATREPVGKLLSDRVANSAALVLVAGLIAIPLSLLLGVLAAVRRDGWFDQIGSTTGLVLAAIPEFVIALVLVLVFATTLVQWLPAVSLAQPGERVWSSPQSMVLPVATLVLAVVPYLARVMRSSMVEILASDYVTNARLRGLSRRRVTWRHALPNAIVPGIQASALQLAWMASSVVVVEYVFAFPGIGTTLVDAVGNRDIPVVQAVTMIAAAVYVVCNLVADVATILLTPKLRTRAR
ncbi:ABC transporter permease [Conexibacter sp. CPCC 206217]|nr:ABC transporter permease [Conexibacter sp. CPCC 206217]MDO8212620.1 ABC transporter permease [Conexibacter sp. CPCC 206217]